MDDLKTKKILVICESPNKVSHIKEYLKKAGYSVTVAASVGHIANIADDPKSYKNTGIYPEQNFKINYKVSEDKKEIVQKLTNLAKTADYIYIASDPDREGAQIGWSLLKFLKLPKEKCRRMITHEITPKAVVRAFENPVPFETTLVEAAQARGVIDKLIGYSLSGIARTYLGAKSVGRCQSAGLILVVERENEIQNFNPEVYYDLYVNFEKNKTAFKAKYVGTDKVPLVHLPNKTAVDQIKKDCTSEFVIKNIDKKERQESPKPPFCTATYQQEAASKLGLTVKDAMSVAQKLFEQGAITYHRTDDETMSPEFLDTLHKYVDSAFGKKSFTTVRKSKKNDSAQEGHECLRVTDPSMTPTLFADTGANNLQCKAYKLIWQRTVASVLPNAVISETTYNIYNKEHKFNLVSKELVDQGYRVVYNYVDDDQKDDDGLVKETFAVGEKLLKTKLEDVKKETTPPPRFTEATFIKELQKRGIGRPSTFATIVETILSPSRGYCTLEGKSMVPTNKGIQLVNFLDRSFSDIVNVNYTKQMEEGLDKIAEGKEKKLDFLNEFYTGLEKTINESKEFGTTKAGETKTCPLCGKTLVLRRSKWGKLFYGCDYPRCRYTENAQ